MGPMTTAARRAKSLAALEECGGSVLHCRLGRKATAALKTLADLAGSKTLAVEKAILEAAKRDGVI